jgi:hypothetical protein
VLLVCTAGWSVVAVVHSLAAHSDRVRRGMPSNLAVILAEYGPAYLPWVFFTAALFYLLSRRTGPAPAARLFGVLTVGFYLPQVAYQILLFQAQSNRSWRDFWTVLGNWPTTAWLVDFLIYASTFSLVYAWVNVRAALDAERRQQRAEAEALELRLQLEQQRLGALRAQLEPHFLFNALNAISGLVRGDDKPLALTALQQLSALLRYALSASQRDWVSLEDELAFVRDYVTLQSLRYGDRLQLAVEGDTPAVRAADCPPLLLQPLIENAIRHDVECHDGRSEVRLALQLTGTRLTIEVSNAVHAGAASNPGLGLGLPTTRDRLALTYGSAATFSTSLTGDRFWVVMELPVQAPE